MTGMRRLPSPLCVLVVPLAALAACASTPPPNDHLARTQSVVLAALARGAETDPRAALHLKLAQEQLAVAKALMRDGRHTRARALLQRAQADAELALALTRQTEARRDAERAHTEVKTLLLGHSLSPGSPDAPGSPGSLDSPDAPGSPDGRDDEGAAPAEALP